MIRLMLVQYCLSTGNVSRAGDCHEMPCINGPSKKGLRHKTHHSATAS